MDKVDSVFQNKYCPKFKVFKGLGLSPELCQGNSNIWSLVFDISMIQILALYLKFDWHYPFGILKNMLAPYFGWVGLSSGSAKAND